MSSNEVHNPAMLPSASNAAHCPPQQIAKALGNEMNSKLKAATWDGWRTTLNCRLY